MYYMASALTSSERYSGNRVDFVCGHEHTNLSQAAKCAQDLSKRNDGRFIYIVKVENNQKLIYRNHPTGPLFYRTFKYNHGTRRYECYYYPALIYTLACVRFKHTGGYKYE